MNAKTVCTLAWLATQAGACGLERLAVDPKSKGDNHHRHLCLVLGVTDATNDLYRVATPVWDKKSGSRIYKDIPVMLPCEALRELHERDPALVGLF